MKSSLTGATSFAAGSLLLFATVFPAAALDVRAEPPQEGDAPAVTSHWRGSSTYNVPVGTHALFFHYPCSGTTPVAVSGGFRTNSAAQSGMQLVANFARDDFAGANYSEWGWSFLWPNGAASGAQIAFNVYCMKK